MTHLVVSSFPVVLCYIQSTPAVPPPTDAPDGSIRYGSPHPTRAGYFWIGDSWGTEEELFNIFQVSSPTLRLLDLAANVNIRVAINSSLPYRQTGPTSPHMPPGGYPGHGWGGYPPQPVFPAPRPQPINPAPPADTGNNGGTGGSDGGTGATDGTGTGSTSKKKKACVVQTFDKGDLPSFAAQSSNRKLVHSREDTQAYLKALGKHFPAKDRNGNTISDDDDTDVGNADALSRSLIWQPGIRLFGYDLWCEHYALATGHKIPPFAIPTRNIAGCTPDEAYLGMCAQSSSTLCTCAGCSRAVTGINDMLTTASETIETARANRTSRVQDLLSGDLAIGAHGSAKRPRAGLNRGTASAKSKIHFNNRLRGVSGVGKTGRNHSWASQLNAITVGTEELVLNYGIRCGDPGVRAAIAHLGNIINAQSQLMEAMILNPEHISGNTNRKNHFALYRHAFTYMNYATGLSHEIPGPEMLGKQAVIDAIKDHYTTSDS